MNKKKAISEEAIRRFIKFDGPCCNSCHDGDSDMGYSMCEYYEDKLGKNRYASVCCAVSEALDDYFLKKGRNNERVR